MEYNTVTFTASDGARVSFPFGFLVERGAILADKINGEDMQSIIGCSNQLWIPGFPAKYFIRDVVSIEFESRAEPPKLPDMRDDGHDYTNRPNVSCRAEYTCRLGQPMVFEGWADDFDRKIVAVEYSLDDCLTWRRYKVEHADAIRWVWWRFEWIPETEGSYTMFVRAVNEDGDVSPHPASHSFVIEGISGTPC